MKLCVFPNDPIRAYYEKGEIKAKYFNPTNFFDEIHIISPSSSDVEEEKVREIVGKAILKIHSIGEINLINYKSKLEIIRKIIQEVKPDILRSYNPLIQGWYAVKMAKEFNLPSIVSIHTNYDKDNRDEFLKSRKYKKYLRLWFTSKSIEPFVLQNATIVICAYGFLVDYAKKFGAKNIHVIYNKVDLSKFSNTVNPVYNFECPVIINVGRLSPEKNQQCVIKAIQNLNVKLILIGNGPCYDELIKLVKSLGIENKVMFLKKIQNDELPAYYTSADIFVSSMNLGGVSIPFLEAMACGIPVIAPQREKNEKEEIDDAITFVKNEPEFFEKAIMKLLSDEKLRNKMSTIGLKKIQEISADKMEEKEANLYKQLI